MTSAGGTAAGRGAWKWSRTGETRRVLLNAAREVFAEAGFADASVASVVERAGSSVGSLYHHFGGKAELFLALWEDWQSSLESRAATAVAEARQRGERRPMTLFLTGARSFLAGAWDERALGALFMDKDGPPGFELMRRRRSREWLRQNSLLLRVGEDPIDRVTVTVLTTIIGETAREVRTSRTKGEADAIIEAAIAMIERLGPFDVPDDAPAG
jgi:AcrR family transcriptional regulator